MAFPPGVRYGESAVDLALAPFVQLIWTLEVDDPACFGAAERIVPDGIVEAIFHYRVPFNMRHQGTPVERQPPSLVVSQTRRFIEIQPAGPSGFVSVRFYPWGACHFLRAPISELADRSVAAADLWGADASTVQDLIGEARSTAERVTHIQRFLLRQLRQHEKASLEGLLRHLAATRGRRSVRALCLDAGMTERTLEQTCARALGMSPKHFLRVQRFLHTCHLLRAMDRPQLTVVAHQAGYYDQAHCIADFKAFSGMTPGAFVTAEKASFLDID